jgi:hypothetical protein
MVVIRVEESENWRKEVDATKAKKLGKNFLAKIKVSTISEGKTAVKKLQPARSG